MVVCSGIGVPEYCVLWKGSVICIISCLRYGLFLISQRLMKPEVKGN